jgi:hypothetical protein
MRGVDWGWSPCYSMHTALNPCASGGPPTSTPPGLAWSKDSLFPNTSWISPWKNYASSLSWGKWGVGAGAWLLLAKVCPVFLILSSSPHISFSQVLCRLGPGWKSGCVPLCCITLTFPKVTLHASAILLVSKRIRNLSLYPFILDLCLKKISLLLRLPRKLCCLFFCIV